MRITKGKAHPDLIMMACEGGLQQEPERVYDGIHKVLARDVKSTRV